MFDFYRRCRDSSWAFIRNWENIEELYTQADLLRLSGVDLMPIGRRLVSPDELCKHISWCIWEMYRTFNGTRPWANIARMVENAGLNLSIITTNYDLVCEASLVNEMRCFVYPGFEKLTDRLTSELKQPVNIYPDVDKNVIPIIKLHGSVNWFQGKKKWGAFNGIDSRIPHSKLSGLGFARAEMVNICKEQRGGDADWSDPTPAIIPPMLGKSSSAPVIQQNWRAAIGALTRARQVWIIGYSFPATDAFMLRLLTEGLAENTDLEKLIISDIQKHSEWEGRLSSMFQDSFRKQSQRYISFASDGLLDVLSQTKLDEWP
ncbi:SIR2 family protein [Anatilimnocola floriformis]|uniref:SIR2 family protein n=1 Tax=Anatilimnocola floriformis TaxID=2948575 RepID=UPI0020C1C58E|nr:SIR2 family protein [Anatilimnocola floriformis]